MHKRLNESRCEFALYPQAICLRKRSYRLDVIISCTGSECFFTPTGPTVSRHFCLKSSTLDMGLSRRQVCPNYQENYCPLFIFYTTWHTHILGRLQSLQQILVNSIWRTHNKRVIVLIKTFSRPEKKSCIRVKKKRDCHYSLFKCHRKQFGWKGSALLSPPILLPSCHLCQQNGSINCLRKKNPWSLKPLK